MKSVAEKKVIEKVQKIARTTAKKWLKYLKFDGKPDITKIQKILNKRTHEGNKVTAFVARSPFEVIKILDKCLLEETIELGIVDPKAQRKYIKSRTIELKPTKCIWDYSDMAQCETTYKLLPKKYQKIEFLDQSLFPAFKAGLMCVFNFSELLIGLCLPKICMDKDRKYHNTRGPALVWGPMKEWYVHGKLIKDNKEELIKKGFKRSFQ